MKERISISFSVSDNYSQHLAVVLTSVLVNNQDSRFVFHVLHRNITRANQAKIKELERDFPLCEVCFHFIDTTMFDKFPIPVGLEHVTQETYFRYVLADVLADEERTIYSDVDIICRDRIDSIWQVDLKGKMLGAVRNYGGEKCGQNCDIVKLGFSPASPYFFTGFLVMDLARMRKERCSEKFIAATKKHGADVPYIDLDIINMVCEGDIAEIESIWNETSRYSWLRRDVKIWHFPGVISKPWCNIWKNTTWPLYLKYLLKSPYRKNARGFLWGHIKGFFFFKYTKKNVTRYLVCGIRIWKK